MDAIYSPKTFKRDHIVRDKKGGPLGRAVMRNDDAYEEGKDLEISILKIPVEFLDRVIGSHVYIDGFRYKIPGDTPDFRRNRRGKDWIISSFILQRD